MILLRGQKMRPLITDTNPVQIRIEYPAEDVNFYRQCSRA